MNFVPSAPEVAPNDTQSLREPIEAAPAEINEWLQAGQALLVDVREVSEYENERIPGALLMPLSFFDADHFPHIKGMKVVLHCAVGKRSVAAGKQLLKAGFDEAISMTGGLNAWKAGGFLVEND